MIKRIAAVVISCIMDSHVGKCLILSFKLLNHWSLIPLHKCYWPINAKKRVFCVLRAVLMVLPKLRVVSI